jgi:hypothetical protein
MEQITEYSENIFSQIISDFPYRILDPGFKVLKSNSQYTPTNCNNKSISCQVLTGDSPLGDTGLTVMKK